MLSKDTNIYITLKAAVGAGYVEAGGRKARKHRAANKGLGNESKQRILPSA